MTFRLPLFTRTEEDELAVPTFKAAALTAAVLPLTYRPVVVEAARGVAKDGTVLLLNERPRLMEVLTVKLPPVILMKPKSALPLVTTVGAVVVPVDWANVPPVGFTLVVNVAVPPTLLKVPPELTVTVVPVSAPSRESVPPETDTVEPLIVPVDARLRVPASTFVAPV